MNRLVLIGNGFDLAHGLETGYHHFIGYVWKKMYDSLWETLSSNSYGNVTIEHDFYLLKAKDIYKLDQVSPPLVGIHSIVISKDSLDNDNSVAITKSYSLDEIISLFTSKLRFEYSNEFFGIITNGYKNKNWSGIEADYYRELKKAKAKEEKENEAAVEKLNKEFNQIKDLLKDYLKEQNKFQRNEETYKLIYSPILPKEIRLSSWDTYCEDICNRLKRHHKQSINFSQEDLECLASFIEVRKLNHEFDERDWSEIKESLKTALQKKEGKSESETRLHHLFRPEKILLLNFNYTETQANYDTFEEGEDKSFCYQKIETTTCHIHGKLVGDDNPMIFGYGDEEAEDYKEMENSEIRGLLDNVKSINYLNASSYRDMERFIESGLYQIYLMGMSCGLADRTMLRKLFQHPNCISIKPFYYEWEDEKTKEEKNNYTEIVQNVSRCFSDKDLLRSTVVNKINCTPLPQSPLKNKENSAPLYQVHGQ